MFSIIVGLAVALAPQVASTAPKVTVQVARPAPSAEALAAANRLLDAMQYKKMMAQTVGQIQAGMTGTLTTLVQQRTGEVPEKELVDRVAKVINTHLDRYLAQNEDLRRSTALLYAANFTPTELDHMAILYGDPVMQKWSERLPKLMADLMPLIMSYNEAHKDELEDELKAVIQAYSDEQAKTSPGSDS